MFDDTPNKLETAFIQRNASNTIYEQINVSGSDVIFYHNSLGEFTADKISVWAASYGIGTGGTIISGGSYNISASYASRSLSSSISTTASYAASSTNSNTSSYVHVTSNTYFGGNGIVIGGGSGQILGDGSAQFADGNVIITADGYITAINITSSLHGTASFARNALSSAYAPSSPSISSSYAVSASYAPSGGRTIVLCTAYTPTSIGADAAEIPMPYSTNGLTPVSWSVKRITLRTQTSESVLSSISIEKSVTSGIFSAISLGILNLSGGSYEAFTGSSGTITSGEKMRFYVNQLGTSQNWTITVEVSHI